MGHVSHTQPPLGLFVTCMLGLVMINVYAKFEIPIFTHYSNVKGNAKCIKYEKLHIKSLAAEKQPSKILKIIASR